MRIYGIGAALVVLVWVVFGEALRFHFVDWDDNENITNNPLYTPLATSQIGKLWTVPYYAAYIPITRILWAYLAGTKAGQDGSTVADFDPHVYHAANLVVHSMNAVLVFLIVRFLLSTTIKNARTSIDFAAGFGAAIFALHPLQVEPVAWVTGMKDVLCGFFTLLAFYLYLLHRDKSGSMWTGLLVGSTVAYVLAILSKSSAVTLPLIVFVVDWLLSTREGDGRQKLSISKLGLLGLWLIAAIPVVLKTKQAEVAAGIRIPMVPMWQRPFVMGDTLTFYLWKTIAPVGLGPDYGRTPVWVMSHGWAYAMIAVPIVLVVAAFLLRRRSVLPLIAVAIWLLSILPVSGLTPFDFQLYSTTADRYMYFAMVGVALAVAGLLAKIPVRFAVPVGGVVVVFLAVLAAMQAPIWKDTKALFRQGLRVNPHSSVSHLSVGHEFESAGDGDKAIAEYREAIADNPMSEQAHNNLGEALGKKWSTSGQPPSTSPLLAEAKAELERSVALRDNFPDGHANLGNVYYSLGRYADALAQFQAALKYDADNVQDDYMAGVVLQAMGNVDESRVYLQKAADRGYQPAVKAVTGQ